MLTSETYRIKRGVLSGTSRLLSYLRFYLVPAYTRFFSKNTTSDYILNK